MGRPLHLCEILEEEHAVLYPGDPLEKKWTVDARHIRDANAIVEACREAFPGKPFRPQSIVDDLNDLIDSESLARPAYRLSDKLEETIARCEDRSGAELRHLNRLIVDEVSDCALLSGEEARLIEYFKRVHARGNTSALCISGGGIRSATFALGVIQGLARRNVLDKFDYLSTVSGGGYIGGWLSSWTRRHREGIRGVCEDLSRQPNDAIDPEPAPVRHLREHSNYLTPKLGVTSGDTWALAATYVRNLVLNWFIIIPLLIAVLALPRLVSTLFFTNIFDAFTPYAPQFLLPVLDWLALHNGWILFYAGLGAFFTGLVYLGLRRPRVNRYRRSGKGGDDAEFRRFCLIPLTAGATFFAASWAIYKTLSPDGPYPDRWAALMMIGGPVAVWFVDTLRYYRTDPAQRREDIGAQVRGKKPYWRKFGMELVAAVVAGTLSHFLLRFFATVFPDPSDGYTLSTFPSPILAIPEALPSSALYLCFAVPLIMASLFISATVFVGVAGNVNEDYDREWWARSSGWVLTAILAWPIIFGTVIFGPVLIWFAPKIVAAAGGAGTLAAVLLGRSAKSRGKEGAEPKSDLVARFAAPAIILFLFAAISLLTTEIVAGAQRIEPLSPKRIETGNKVTWELTDGFIADDWSASNARAWHHLNVIQYSDGPLLLLLIAGAALLSYLAAKVINVNKFSMHSMYRNRLIRAYFGASRATRDPNPFTGFDPQDNIACHALRPELLWLTSFRDFDGFVTRLIHAPRDTFADHLRAAIKERRANIFSQGLDAEGRRDVLFQVLNCVLEEVDLATFAGAKRRHPTLVQRITDAFDAQPAVLRDPKRLVANRRILDDHFRAELYPFEAPLLHRGDVKDPATLAAAFHSGLGLALAARFADPQAPARLAALDDQSYPATLARVLNEVNRLMTTIRFDDLLAGTDPRPVDATFGMLDNRRLLDQHLGAPNLDKAVVTTTGTDIPLDAAIHPIHPPRPMHMVNAALNLVAGQNLAWQERKAESFTFSPLHSGSYRLGYRSSVDYGGPAGVTLGTAVTISGAAASPNMGYHSSLPLALLMAFFNVRLGWWLGNPGPHGDETFRDASPSNALRPLVAEALGDTDDTFPYVYLSDGGHFENLGIYEMVLRRRRFIVVSDGGCDGQFAFEDLGNAIRKIRTDFGIPIEMDEPMNLFPRTDTKHGKYCALGRIRYSAVDGGVTDGVLLYFKPAVYLDDEPKDVYNYAKACADFPHESTADQFFSESQFESYRALGNHVIDDLCAGLNRLGLTNEISVANWTARSLEQFFGVAEEYLYPLQTTQTVPHAPLMPPRRRSPRAEA